MNLTFLLYLFYFAVSYYLSTEAPINMDKPFIANNLLLAFSMLVIHAFVREPYKSLHRQYFKHSTIFLVAYVVVFYQYDIDYALSIINETEGSSLIWYDYTVVCKALCYANMGMSAFLAGYHVNKKSIYNKHSLQKTYSFRSITPLIRFVWLLTFIYIVTVNKSYLFGGYGARVPEGDIAHHVAIYIQGFLTGLVVINAYLIKQRGFYINGLRTFWLSMKQPILLCLTNTALILMSGRRTEAVQDILILLGSFLYLTHYKFKIKQLVIPFFSLSLLMAVIAFLRINSDQNVDDAINHISGSSTISPLTQELAFNCSSMHIALSNLNDSGPFLYGIPWLIGACAIVPGLQGMVISTVGLPTFMINSSSYITMLGLEDMSWGLGTSIVADAYVNFNIYGVVIVMALLGLFLRLLEVKLFCDNVTSPFMLGVSLCAYGSLVYLSRSSIDCIIGPLSYVLICIFLMRKKQVRK